MRKQRHQLVLSLARSAGFDTVAKLRTVRAADLDALGVDDAHRPAMEAALQRLGPAEEGEEEEGDAGEGERGDTFFFDTEQTVPPSTKLKVWCCRVRGLSDSGRSC